MHTHTHTHTHTYIYIYMYIWCTYIYMYIWCTYIYIYICTSKIGLWRVKSYTEREANRRLTDSEIWISSFPPFQLSCKSNRLTGTRNRILLVWLYSFGSYEMLLSVYWCFVCVQSLKGLACKNGITLCVLLLWLIVSRRKDSCNMKLWDDYHYAFSNMP
jgi:hypothetical protein